jgi:hypothetical protein
MFQGFKETLKLCNLETLKPYYLIPAAAIILPVTPFSAR